MLTSTVHTETLQHQHIHSFSGSDIPGLSQSPVLSPYRNLRRWYFTSHSLPLHISLLPTLSPSILRSPPHPVPPSLLPHLHRHTLAQFLHPQTGKSLCQQFICHLHWKPLSLDSRNSLTCPLMLHWAKGRSSTLFHLPDILASTLGLTPQPLVLTSGWLCHHLMFCVHLHLHGLATSQSQC